MAFRYEYTNTSRITCPFCHKQGKFSGVLDKSTGKLTPLEFGICSSCNRYKLPPDNFIPDGFGGGAVKEFSFLDADTIPVAHYDQYYKTDNPCLFLTGLKNWFGFEAVKRVYNQYKLGIFYDGAVIFPYFYNKNHLSTGKIMWFMPDLHRNRDKHPLWLHNLKYTTNSGHFYDFSYEDWETDENGNEVTIPFKLKLPLFGHHLISNDRSKSKTVCIVESEKTAVVMAIVMPQYIWIATGGKGMIKQPDKFTWFMNRDCFAFPDCSEGNEVLNEWADTFKRYNAKYGYNIQVIDWYTEFFAIKGIERNKQDLADLVLDYPESLYVEYMKRTIV